MFRLRLTMIRSAHRRPLVLLLAAALFTACLPAASTRDFLKKPEAWFATEEASGIAASILSYQSDFGGWPKNLDLTDSPFKGRREELVGELKPIFDNGATTDEIRFLARMFKATGNAAYARAVQNAIDYILIAQYPTGGWPQSYPPDTQYHRHITFNDDTMVRIMTLLQEITRPGSDAYEFLDPDQRKAVEIAFRRGVECILKCQIKVNGKPTAWCAQHDEIDLSPRPARRFELVSLSGAETVKIVELLMSLPSPSPEVAESVESATAWLQSARIVGWRVAEGPGDEGKGNNFTATSGASAPALWARFYDIETNQPLWSNLDGVRKLGMANIGWARHGYAWTGNWPQTLLEKDYPAWKARLANDGTGPALQLWQPTVRIALAGDSTVTDTAGWGFGFKKAVAAGVLCQNFAGGGQSSKSFRSTGMWAKVLASKPDYVLIQFGHNDMPGKGPNRETDPATTYAENLRRYVRETREAGAKPILVTSLVRRIFNRDGSGQLRGELAPYVEAMKAIAAELQVPLVDLYTLSLNHAVKLGPDGVAPYEPLLPAPPPKAAVSPTAPAVPSPAPQTPSAPVPTVASAPAADIDFPAATATLRRDGTHLNVKGSVIYGEIVARELLKILPLPEAEKNTWFRHPKF
ncbi:MAG: pectate lyase [Verrucomicrobium sp.]